MRKIAVSFFLSAMAFFISASLACLLTPRFCWRAAISADQIGPTAVQLQQQPYRDVLPNDPPVVVTSIAGTRCRDMREHR